MFEGVGYIGGVPKEVHQIKQDAQLLDDVVSFEPSQLVEPSEHQIAIRRGILPIGYQGQVVPDLEGHAEVDDVFEERLSRRHLNSLVAQDTNDTDV